MNDGHPFTTLSPHACMHQHPYLSHCRTLSPHLCSNGSACVKTSRCSEAPIAGASRSPSLQCSSMKEMYFVGSEGTPSPSLTCTRVESTDGMSSSAGPSLKIVAEHRTWVLRKPHNHVRSSLCLAMTKCRGVGRTSPCVSSSEP